MNNIPTAVIVGVCDKKGSTNIPMAKSLMNVGFNTIPVNYRTIINDYGMQVFEEYLLHIMVKYNPVITIFCKCNGIKSDIISKCNNYTRTFLFNMDPRRTIERCPEVLEHAKRSHFSSCTAVDVAKWFIECGANCKYLPQGIDPEVFKSVAPVDDFEADISFIGSYTSEREMYLKRLQAEGYVVKAYGRGFSDREIYDREFCQVCCSSKMMLSLNTYNEHRQYFSNRLPRMMACGTCCLHIDPYNDIDNLFKDNKEIVLFKDINFLTL